MYTVKFQDQVLAIIIPADFDSSGVKFFTPDNYSQQLAYMKHPVGVQIKAHTHNEIKREVLRTLEVLFIRRGRLRIDFYQTSGEYIESYVLGSGDTILLVSAGHGFEVLEEVEMFEVKQGPYTGEKDKTLFSAVSPEQVRIKSHCQK